MHYVLLWWFKENVQPLLKGYSGIVIYADDFVTCFQYKEDAELFYSLLKNRMGNFGLELEEEKSRLIEFGRFAESNCARRSEKPETFTFLGFTHYCSKSKSGRFRVKRKTSKRKFSKKVKEIHKMIGNMRLMRTGDIVRKLNEILVGYFHYYKYRHGSHWSVPYRTKKESKRAECIRFVKRTYPGCTDKILVFT